MNNLNTEKIWVVITTINLPTKAIKVISSLAKQKNWEIVVVGDNKTNDEWSYDHVKFLSVTEQKKIFGSFSDSIPYNHYCRKNLGYLYAIQNGATVILETDDDNIPYDTFGGLINQNLELHVVEGDRWVNIYRYFTNDLIWPRGLPLEKIHTVGFKNSLQKVSSPIQQFLADDDPDVDAIYRLIYKEPVKFDKDAESLALEKNCYVPFNSQNTVFFKEAFPLLYLPCYVSFRMTDIWRSFVAQRIIWQQNQHLVFHKATVSQERNVHNLMKDFTDEIDGYINNDKIAYALEQVNLDGLTLTEQIYTAWESLFKINIITPEELNIIENWLKFFENI